MAAAAVEGAAAPAPAQQPAPAYRLVAGDDLGVLRVVEVPGGPKWEATAAVAKWGQPDKQHAVHCLASSSTNLDTGGPALLAVGRAGRRLDVLDAMTGVQQASLALPPAAAAAAAAVPLSTPQAAAVVAAAFVPAAAGRPLRLVAGTADGVVNVCSCSSSSSSDNGGWRLSSSFTVGPNLACLAVDSAGTHVVVGGEGFQPAIWELESGSRVWQGKGGKPNAIRLVDKPYTTALAFLPSLADATGASGGSAVATATGSGSGSGSSSSSSSIARRFMAGSAVAKLQLYDTAAGRRPQREVVFGEARVTAIAPEPHGECVWAANGTGHMQLLVLSSFKLQDALKGAGGSVRALALQPGGPAAGEPALLASVGLDRFLRLHDARSRAGRARAYLKQQLSAVAWLPVPVAAATAAAAAVQAPVGATAAAAAATKKSKKSKQRRAGGAADVAAAAGDDQHNGVSTKKRAKKH